MTRSRTLSGSVVVLLALASPATAQSGSVEGTLTVNGEAVALRHASVHEEEHPFEEGQKSFVVTLSENEIPYLELDDMCPGPYGNRALQLELDATGDVISTSYCFAGGNSSGQDFGVELSSHGPTEFAGRIASELEVFDDQVAFDLTFSATLPEGPVGEPLPVGGGEPGAAYLAWQSAVEKEDLKAIRKSLPADKREMFEAMSETEQKEIVGQLKAMAATGVKILEGRLVGDVAYLQVEGTMEGETVQGEVKMEKQGGVWVATSESWKF